MTTRTGTTEEHFRELKGFLWYGPEIVQVALSSLLGLTSDAQNHPFFRKLGLGAEFLRLLTATDEECRRLAACCLVNLTANPNFSLHLSEIDAPVPKDKALDHIVKLVAKTDTSNRSLLLSILRNCTTDKVCAERLLQTGSLLEGLNVVRLCHVLSSKVSLDTPETVTEYCDLPRVVSNLCTTEKGRQLLMSSERALLKRYIVPFMDSDIDYALISNESVANCYRKFIRAIWDTVHNCSFFLDDTLPFYKDYLNRALAKDAKAETEAIKEKSLLESTKMMKSATTPMASATTSSIGSRLSTELSTAKGMAAVGTAVASKSGAAVTGMDAMKGAFAELQMDDSVLLDETKFDASAELSQSAKVETEDSLAVAKCEMDSGKEVIMEVSTAESSGVSVLGQVLEDRKKLGTRLHTLLSDDCELVLEVLNPLLSHLYSYRDSIRKGLCQSFRSSKYMRSSKTRFSDFHIRLKALQTLHGFVGIALLFKVPGQCQWVQSYLIGDLQLPRLLKEYQMWEVEETGIEMAKKIRRHLKRIAAFDALVIAQSEVKARVLMDERLEQLFHERERQSKRQSASDCEVKCSAEDVGTGAEDADAPVVDLGFDSDSDSDDGDLIAVD